jgi:hypothetical protein
LLAAELLHERLRGQLAAEPLGVPGGRGLLEQPLRRPAVVGRQPVGAGLEPELGGRSVGLVGGGLGAGQRLVQRRLIAALGGRAGPLQPLQRLRAGGQQPLDVLAQLRRRLERFQLVELALADLSPADQVLAGRGS